MKRLVVGKSTWLAEHLGASLYGSPFAGRGVTEVEKLQDVWDEIWVQDSALVTPEVSQLHGKVIGYHPTTLQSTEYREVLLAGAGLQTQVTEEDKRFGYLYWVENGDVFPEGAVVVEQKGMMNRDLGLSSSLAGGVTLRKDSSIGEVNRIALESLTDGYTGPLCLDMASNGSVLDFHFGFRPGWVEAALEINKGNFAKSPLDLTDNVACALLVSVPPFPYSTDQFRVPFPTPNVEEFRIPQEVIPHLKWQNVENGALFYATAWGENERAARLRIDRSLRCCEISNIQFRTDVGTTFGKITEHLNSVKEVAA